MDKDRGHRWQKRHGTVNDFGLDEGYHNGPRCEVCDYAYCHHCEDGPQIDCPGPDARAEKEDYSDSKLDGGMVAFDAAIRASVGLPSMIGGKR